MTCYGHAASAPSLPSRASPAAARRTTFCGASSSSGSHRSGSRGDGGRGSAAEGGGGPLPLTRPEWAGYRGPQVGAFWQGSHFGHGKGRYGHTPGASPAEYGGLNFSNMPYVTLMSSAQKASGPVCQYEKDNAPWPPANEGLASVTRAFFERRSLPTASQKTLQTADMDWTTRSGIVHPTKKSPYKNWSQF
eukprot:CAMPEP_0179272236 /NCGR_PEP_ID=MMETSP0797-20121207/32392_1 /TAXON_ID=47934 /ORGANISM="Dinophysis acuminata, Strain DAEP01" /LENGTH=190 /DNA_ID=CAMNT_0020980623 /DNA_START=13 /DNA_END=585 /DNA_ORIENTATION=-